MPERRGKLLLVREKEAEGRTQEIFEEIKQALGIPFVFFSSQVKPYACDVAATLLVVALALRGLRRRTTAAAVALGIAGAVIPFFSFTSVFVLAGARPAAAQQGMGGTEDTRSSYYARTPFEKQMQHEIVCTCGHPGCTGQL